MDQEAPPFTPLALAIGGLLAMAAAVGIGRFIYTPILPPMNADLGLSQGDAGIIAAANYVGYLLGALAASQQSLPGSPRAWLLASLIASAITTAAMAAFDGMTAFLVLRFAGGIASALVLVFASALVLERLASVGRNGLSAVHFAGVGTGIATSAVIAWAVLEAGLGWRGIWLIGGGIALAATIAVAICVPGARSRGASNADHVQRPAVAMHVPPESRPALNRLTLAYGLFGFGYIITATFIVAIVRANAESASIEPIVWLAVGLAGAPSIVVWNAVAARLGVLKAFAIACLVEAVGVAASVLATSPAWLIAAAILVGGTFMGITALGLIAARGMAGPAGRRAVGLLTAAFGLGQIIGPLVAGYGHEWTGSFLAPSLLAVGALILSAALTVTLEPPPRPT